MTNENCNDCVHYYTCKTVNWGPRCRAYKSENSPVENSVKTKAESKKATKSGAPDPVITEEMLNDDPDFKHLMDEIEMALRKDYSSKFKIRYRRPHFVDNDSWEAMNSYEQGIYEGILRIEEISIKALDNYAEEMIQKYKDTPYRYHKEREE